MADSSQGHISQLRRVAHPFGPKYTTEPEGPANPFPFLPPHKVARAAAIFLRLPEHSSTVTYRLHEWITTEVKDGSSLIGFPTGQPFPKNGKGWAPSRFRVCSRRRSWGAPPAQWTFKPSSEAWSIQ